MRPIACPTALTALFGLLASEEPLLSQANGMRLDTSSRTLAKVLLLLSLAEDF
jgi:hypothetical protein